MGNEKNLMDVMNEVSSALDAGSFTPSLPKGAAPMSEMDAFRRLDPLLASLYKEYLNAKQIRLQAVKEYGANDAMTDMAQLSEDSAWCAMQTRYMELRADRELMQQARAIMDENLREERAEKRRRDEDEKLALFSRLQMIENMEKQSSDDGAVMIWVLALLWQYQHEIAFFRPYQASYQFNRLAA